MARDYTYPYGKFIRRDDGRIEVRKLRTYEMQQLRRALLDWMRQRGINVDFDKMIEHPDDLVRQAFDMGGPVLRFPLKKSEVIIHDYA